MEWKSLGSILLIPVCYLYVCFYKIRIIFCFSYCKALSIFNKSIYLAPPSLHFGRWHPRSSLEHVESVVAACELLVAASVV